MSRSGLGRVYGWRRDLPDDRDHVLTLPPARTAAAEVLPRRVDLSERLPPAWDQGGLGSCTAFALAALVTWLRRDLDPSRLWIYWQERQREGTTAWDSGASLRDGIKALLELGAAPEALWPYSDADPGRYQERPPEPAWVAAERVQAIRYARVPRQLCSLRGILADGWPFAFGMTVCDSFESEFVRHTGTVCHPARDERRLGGHAMTAVGYDDEERVFIVRNSWGPDWGRCGYCWIPYSVLLDSGLSDDFWAVLETE